MRLILLPTVVAFAAVACGSGPQPATSQAAAATPAQPAAAADSLSTAARHAPTTSAPSSALSTSATPAAAAIVEVKMTGNGTSQAAFVPAALTIKPGTTVRFLNVSGGPHNIAFYADSIPKGAADVLNKGMANTMGPLTGPFLTQPNEKYDVAFAGAPAGVYKGYCMPHVALGMHVTITVQ